MGNRLTAHVEPAGNSQTVYGQPTDNLDHPWATHTQFVGN